MHDATNVGSETREILELAFFCDKYGWTPSQVKAERADLLDYLIVIESAKSKRRKRDEKKSK